MREGGAVMPLDFLMPSRISARVIRFGLKVILARERASVLSFGMSMAPASTSANSWDSDILGTGLDPVTMSLVTARFRHHPAS
jgi:hypothetical protein